ncbi:MAG: hypothetical protein AAF657_29330 [Acidobacteriota bacterium]
MRSLISRLRRLPTEMRHLDSSLEPPLWPSSALGIQPDLLDFQGRIP